MSQGMFHRWHTLRLASGHPIYSRSLPHGTEEVFPLAHVDQFDYEAAEYWLNGYQVKYETMQLRESTGLRAGRPNTTCATRAVGYARSSCQVVERGKKSAPGLSKLIHLPVDNHSSLFAVRKKLESTSLISVWRQSSKCTPYMQAYTEFLYAELLSASASRIPAPPQ
jgi:hypothetical protein